jgi:hypothetical protein
MDREVAYRRMASNIFLKLSRENVQQIAYVRLRGKEDTTKYSATAAKPAGPLDLMEALEQHGLLCQDNIDGLKEVLKDANRTDLVSAVEKEMGIPKTCCLKRVFRTAGPKLPTPDTSPTDRSAARVKTAGQQKHGWGAVNNPVPPGLSGGVERPATASKAVEGTPKKKVPLMPPTANKKMALEATSLAKTPEQQQLVLPQSPSLSLRAGSGNSPSSKPIPPPRPPPPPKSPMTVRRSHAEKTDEGDKDSGMYSWSASDRSGQNTTLA